MTANSQKLVMLCVRVPKWLSDSANIAARRNGLSLAKFVTEALEKECGPNRNIQSDRTPKSEH
jgi:predicted HicB family RNase H-like nuclease